VKGIEANGWRFLSQDWPEGSRFKQGIKALVKEMKAVKAKRIRRLNLSCYWKSDVNDVRLKEICVGMRRLVMLQNINLELSSSRGKSDVSLKNLGKSFKRLKFLRDLTLDFSGNEEMTDRGVSQIGKSLKRLVSLESLSIIFNR